MPRPDEGLIHAWLDGQLPPDEAARVEELAATDADWSAAVAEARGLVAASSRILSALDHVPSGVIPQRTLSHGTRRLPWWTKVAAAVVLVVGMSSIVLWRDAVPVIPNDSGSRSASPAQATSAPVPSTPAPTARVATVPPAANTPARIAKATPSPVNAGASGAKALDEPSVMRRDSASETTQVRADAAKATLGVERREVAAVAVERSKAESAANKDRLLTEMQPTAAGAAPTAAPAAARMSSLQAVGGVAAQARKAGAACYRLQEEGPPTTQIIVMRHVRTDGDTLRLEPIDAKSPSPIRAWLVLRDGTAHGAMTLAPNFKSAAVPVVAMPVTCRAP